MNQRKAFVKTKYINLSKRCKSSLLGVNLSSCYVKTRPQLNDAVNIMNEIRDIYAIRPFQGYRRMTLDLKDIGYTINHKKVYRLMKAMGLQAVYPKANVTMNTRYIPIY